MKKFFRFLAILIIILAVGYLVLCLASGDKSVVEKKITINAPEEVVWTAMSDYNHWDNWNPWKADDSTVTSTVTGPAGAVGQRSSWVSENSGSGEMTITSVEGHVMKYDMHFIEPFESDAKGWVRTEKDGDKTIASWGFSNKPSFFMRGMSVLMKPMLEKSFEKGLNLLKDYAESGTITVSLYNIQEVTFPATNYASLRQKVKFADMTNYFENAYGKIYAAAATRVDTTKPSAAIYYTWDTENKESELAAAFPVNGTEDIKGLDMVNIPQSPAYLVEYRGGYSGSEAAHMAIGEHMAKNGKEMKMVVEQYVISAHTEPDSSKWVTRIYYILK